MIKKAILRFPRGIKNAKYPVLFALVCIISFASCSRKPAELLNDGMKSFAAGDYTKAQEDFEEGIKKSGSDTLYAGFIAANLVTGKYGPVNSAYNNFTDGIHQALIKMYGEREVKFYGIAKDILPYKTDGANKVPPDFPTTVAIQAIADHQGFYFVKQQIDNILRK